MLRSLVLFFLVIVLGVACANNDQAPATRFIGVAAKDWVTDVPPGTPVLLRIEYTDQDAFDHRLYKSLDADRNNVEVVVDGVFKSTSPPERFARWAYRLELAGGEIRTCLAKPDEGFIAVIRDIKTVVKPLVKEWLAYRAIGEYNAVVYVQEDGETVESIRLVRRTGPFDPC